MKAWKTYFVLLTLSLLMWSCGGGDNFRISGEIEGLGTQNLNVVYYGDGAVRTMRTALVEGKFMFDGVSREWTTVYIYSSSRALLATVIAKNGEGVQVNINIEQPTLSKYKGNKPTQLLGDWLAKNNEVLDSDNVQAINEVVRKFVEENKGNIAATVALVNYYRPGDDLVRADSLFRVIEPKARPSYMAEGWMNLVEMARDSINMQLPPSMDFLDIHDSIVNVDMRSATLLLYSPLSELRNEEIDSLLADRYKKIRKDTLRIKLLEVDRNVSDTVTWKRAVRNDSLAWRRLWHPFNSRRLPYAQASTFIVADSTGTILYNGNEIWDAIRTINVY